jgi:toxin CptA
MPRPHAHPIPSPKLLSPLGRGLGALQLAKETATIVLLGMPLLLGRPLLVLAILPGLVLYLFRWVMVLGNTRRRVALVIWLFTLLDELWGLILYLRATGGAPTLRQLRYLDWSYRLGLAFSVAALLEIGYRRYRDRADLRALLKAT